VVAAGAAARLLLLLLLLLCQSLLNPKPSKGQGSNAVQRAAV